MVTFCAIITVSRSKGSTVFCNLELPALKTVLKIWLNPGLNLTIFRGTWPRNPIPRIWDPRRRIQSTGLSWNPLRRATLSPKGNSYFRFSLRRRPSLFAPRRWGRFVFLLNVPSGEEREEKAVRRLISLWKY